MRSTEEQVFSADEMEGIALRYGLLYGQDSFTRMIINLVRKRRLPVPSSGGGFVGFIYLEDPPPRPWPPGEGRAGQAYNIVDDEPVRGPTTWTRSRRTRRAQHTRPDIRRGRCGARRVARGERVDVVGPADRFVVDDVVRLSGAVLVERGHGRGGGVLQVDEWRTRRRTRAPVAGACAPG